MAKYGDSGASRLTRTWASCNRTNRDPNRAVPEEVKRSWQA